MGKYGVAAVRAAELLTDGQIRSPEAAWELATEEVFPTKSSREKGCPKGAFLGLCQEGLVKGVGPGEYTKSKDNKEYAVRALSLLKKNPSLADDSDLLWSKVVENKTPNSQMDVVISLWRKGMLA